MTILSSKNKFSSLVEIFRQMPFLNTLWVVFIWFFWTKMVANFSQCVAQSILNFHQTQVSLYLFEPNFNLMWYFSLLNCHFAVILRNKTQNCAKNRVAVGYSDQMLAHVFALRLIVPFCGFVPQFHLFCPMSTSDCERRVKPFDCSKW